MGKIILYSDDFEYSIKNLIDILYQNQYFAFEESAIFYTVKIFNFIEDNIELPISKNSPENFRKFGDKYLKYKANNQTTWYIFFFQKNNQFLVNHILNNHTQEFPDLI